MCRGRGDEGRGADGSGPGGSGSLARLRRGREGGREGENRNEEEREISDKFQVSMNSVSCPLVFMPGPSLCLHACLPACPGIHTLPPEVAQGWVNTVPSSCFSRATKRVAVGTLGNC